MSNSLSRICISIVFACALAVLFCLGAGGTALAGAGLPGGQPGSEACVECHLAETQSWLQSPHHRQAVTCETCHGALVSDHPEAGVMQLNADARICMSCHTTTTDEWRHSQHAQNNVLCTSCHVSHSQETRLSSEVLCGSCHSEQIGDFTHTAHHSEGVTCIDCHASTSANGADHGHQFTAIDSRACIDCHAATIHEEAGRAGKEAQLQAAQLRTTSEELGAQLETAERRNRSLQAVSVAGLGIGLGIGGLLGIAFALAVSAFNRGGKVS